MPYKLLLLFALLLPSWASFSSIAAAEQGRAITHEDLWLMPRVGAYALSPDGSQVVVAVTTPGYNTDEQGTHLWLLDTEGEHAPRQLTFVDSAESQMAWHPTGQQIAFRARRSGDSHAQIYLLDLQGGGEARRVTQFEGGAGQPAFSPDGSQLLFTSEVQVEFEEEADASHADANVRVYTGFPIRNWNRWLDGRQARIFVQDLPMAYPHKGEPRDLLADSALVRMPGFAAQRTAGGQTLNPVWAPDGESIVFVASTNRDRFAFDFTNQDLWQVGLDGSEPRRLTGSSAPAGDDNWSSPSFSPDGRFLLAQRTPRTELVYNASDVVVLDWPRARELATITLPERRASGGFAVAADNSTVYVLSDDAGHVKVFAGHINGGEAQLAFDMDVGMYAGLQAGQHHDEPVLIARYESSTEPAEVVRIDVEQGAHRRLSEFAVAQAAELDLQPLEHFWTRTEDGFDIHSMLVKPANFDPNRQYPLFVMMHGGPHLMYRDYFFLRWNYHLLAGEDYVLVLSNYRGSTGFGEAFAQAIQFDPLRGPANDINAAADEAIRRFDFIDGDRQCAGGASYGGHLANWMQASTDRYACLVSHAGLVNLITQWGTSDAVYHREVNMGGPPWQLPEVWADQNPLTYADQWSTPTLVTIGMLDERVPLANSLEYWTALQRQQIESRLLVYPQEDHWIMNGHNSRHFYDEVNRWLGRFLLDQ